MIIASRRGRGFCYPAFILRRLRYERTRSYSNAPTAIFCRKLEALEVACSRRPTEGPRDFCLCASPPVKCGQPSPLPDRERLLGCTSHYVMVEAAPEQARAFRTMGACLPPLMHSGPPRSRTAPTAARLWTSHYGAGMFAGLINASTEFDAPFPRKVEVYGELLEREDLRAVQPVTSLDYISLPFRHGDPVVDMGFDLVRFQTQSGGMQFSSASDSPIDGSGSISNGASSESHALVERQQTPHFLRVAVDQVRQRPRPWVPARSASPGGASPQHHVEFLDHMHRQSDRA